MQFAFCTLQPFSNAHIPALMLLVSASCSRLQFDLWGLCEQTISGDSITTDRITVAELQDLLCNFCRSFCLFLVSSNRLQRPPLTCGACAKKIISGDSITADIIKLAELKPEELLYWSHDNRALSHLPYMIILDRWVVLLLHVVAASPQ